MLVEIDSHIRSTSARAGFRAQSSTRAIKTRIQGPHRVTAGFKLFWFNRPQWRRALGGGEECTVGAEIQAVIDQAAEPATILLHYRYVSICCLFADITNWVPDLLGRGGELLPA